MANLTFLGLGVGGLIPSLCNLFCLGSNYSSPSDSRSLRYFSMVLLIFSNSNIVAFIFFYIYSTPSIAWGSVEVGVDFSLASGFPAANLFCNTWLNSSYVLLAGSSTRPVRGDHNFK